MSNSNSLKYTPSYCEENIWQLAQEDCFSGDETLVALISGKGPYRPLWFQRSAEFYGAPVYWDYHVVLLSNQNGWQVWDLDSRLDLACPAETYLQQTFLPSNHKLEDADVIFRLIAAEDYLRSFASDRAHMQLPSGEWLAPPPDWPLIMPADKPNLLDWLDVANATPGRLMTLAELLSSVGDDDFSLK